MNRKFVRDFSAGEYLDLFLVTAVSAVLFIRLFLKITGFPRLGGESLHVAHVLWGGLLMLAAIILLFSFLNRFSRKLAAVLGGAGFGAFIDEAGKFLTHDNDYFFRPTPAIIYVVFILTYLAIRSLTRRGRASQTELVVNALKEAGQAAIGNINHEERDRALGYLARCDPSDPLVARLKGILENSEAVRPAAADPLVRARRAAHRFYWSLTGIPWFGPALITFFVCRLAVEIFHAVSVIVFHKSWMQALAGGSSIEKLGSESTTITYFDVSMISFSTLEAVLVGAGAWLVRRSRPAAYGMFQKSILVSIFFIQPLLFYRDQWGALIGFSVNILVFLALRFMIARERLT
jgi:hypothetical protein